MKNYILVIIIFFFVFEKEVQAQVFGAKNQFEFEHLSGLQRVLWENQSASSPYHYNTIDYNSSYGFNYFRKVSKNLQFTTGLAYGRETFKIRIKDNLSQGDPEELKFNKWNQNFQLKFGVRYTEKTSERSNIALHFGYGQHLQWSISSPPAITLSNQNVQTVERSSNSYFTGFLYAIPEYQLKLNNNDLVSFKLGIQLFNEAYKQGIYYTGENKPWYNPSSISDFSAKRGNLQFGLGYTFTRKNKADYYKSQLNDNENRISKILKNRRIERREHSDTAGFIGVQVGAGINRLQIGGENSFIQNQPLARFSLRLNYERNLTKDWFLEAGYHFLEYFDSYRFENDNTVLQSSGNIYYTHQASIGGGYRLAINTIPIVNIHGGLTLGLVPGHTYLDSEFTNNQHLTTENELNSRVFASGYLGLSKDIHLSNRLILTLNYRWHQGFNTISTHEYSLIDQDPSDNVESTTGRYTGSESSIMIGLKVKIHK